VKNAGATNANIFISFETNKNFKKAIDIYFGSIKNISKKHLK
jgi:hypothetical protein